MVFGKKFKSGLTIGKLTTILADQMLLTALPQVVNALPNAPPLLKAGVDLATGLGQLEIADKIANGVPAPANKILKAAIEIEGITQVIEAIPNLLQAFGAAPFLAPKVSGQ